ncbi:hypothetical protein [Neosynechococcus sphagnicola]|nr:hypothetical protein [Neosynechococcus sphagnicola]
MNKTLKVALLLLPLIIYMGVYFYLATSFTTEVDFTKQKTSPLCRLYRL